MEESKTSNQFDNEKLQNTPFEDCIDAFLMEIRSHLLEGDFNEGYRTLMRMACDISIIYAILNEVPLDDLVKEHYIILKERINLAKFKIHEAADDDTPLSTGIFNKGVVN